MGIIPNGADGLTPGSSPFGIWGISNNVGNMFNRTQDIISSLLMDGVLGSDGFGDLTNIFESILLAPLSLLGIGQNDIVTGITEGIFNLLNPLFGIGGSQSNRAGISAPPPATTAPSGVITSMAYLAEQVAILQSGAIILAYSTNFVWIKENYPGAKTVEIVLGGGAGGGARGSSNQPVDGDLSGGSTVSNHGCGGGGGGYTRELYDINDLPTYLAGIIGAGGAGGSGSGQGAVNGGNGHATTIYKPGPGDVGIGDKLLEAGGGYGGLSGPGDAPSDTNKGVNGYGNQGSFASGGNGGQGSGSAQILAGVGFGAVFTPIPARVTPAQNGNPGPYSPGGARPTISAAPGNPGVFPQWLPAGLGPNTPPYGASVGVASGASGGAASEGSSGSKGGRGGHGTTWSSGGGGGGSSPGSPSQQNAGDGGNGGSGVAFFIVRFS